MKPRIWYVDKLDEVLELVEAAKQTLAETIHEAYEEDPDELKRSSMSLDRLLDLRELTATNSRTLLDSIDKVLVNLAVTVGAITNRLNWPKLPPEWFEETFDDIE